MACIQKRKDSNSNTKYPIQVRLEGQQSNQQRFAKWVQRGEIRILSHRFAMDNTLRLPKLRSILIDCYIENVLPTKPKSQKR